MFRGHKCGTFNGLYRRFLILITRRFKSSLRNHEGLVFQRVLCTPQPSELTIQKGRFPLASSKSGPRQTVEDACRIVSCLPVTRDRWEADWSNFLEADFWSRIAF